MNAYDAVLFISFGGPEKEADVLPFLEIVTRGRGIPRARLLEVADHYVHMGGRSPINAITRRQANALEKELSAQGMPLPVYIGQRNWHPFVEDALRRMKAQGVQKAIGFVTAAHRSEASLERYIQAVEAARAAIGPDAPVIDYVDPWFDHPLFVAAIAARVEEALAGAQGHKGTGANGIETAPLPQSAPWYFIAHSIPCAMAKGSTYVPELQRTMELVCQKLGKTVGKLAYSSRSGRPSDPWLVPDVNEVIRAEKAAGRTDILFITIGFIADHVEVLFDQDVEARATAEDVGIHFHRTQTVGDHPLFIRMMAEVIRARTRTAERPEQRRSATTRYSDQRLEEAVGVRAAACFCDPSGRNSPCLSSGDSDAR